VDPGVGLDAFEKREKFLSVNRATIKRLFRPQPGHYPDYFSLYIGYFNL